MLFLYENMKYLKKHQYASVYNIGDDIFFTLVHIVQIQGMESQT